MVMAIRGTQGRLARALCRTFSRLHVLISSVQGTPHPPLALTGPLAAQRQRPGAPHVHARDPTSPPPAPGSPSTARGQGQRVVGATPRSIHWQPAGGSGERKGKETLKPQCLGLRSWHSPDQGSEKVATLTSPFPDPVQDPAQRPARG